MSSCLVVEDSRLARQELVQLLKKEGRFSHIYEATHATEARKLIQAHALEVVFLDIHLPGENGFELLQSLDQVPPIIFTTAYDEYAVQSFEYNTLDYLLKPIHPDRLAKALEKLSSTEPEVPALPLTQDRHIFVKEGDRCWFVKLTDIRMFESVGNYSRVHFEDQQPMIQKSLNYLEKSLDHNQFFRVNRQQLINLAFIEAIHPWFSGSLQVVLTTGEKIEVSRRQSARIKAMFSI
ncbi:MAG: LytTR family transcriptional regulator DNA-binding domain-containing protein [Bacteroidota bacterium]